MAASQAPDAADGEDERQKPRHREKGVEDVEHEPDLRLKPMIGTAPAERMLAIRNAGRAHKERVKHAIEAPPSGLRETSAAVGFRGLTLAGKRALSARNLTLQSPADRYQAVVWLMPTFYNDKLIVIIDERDKMLDPRHVRSVLLELEGALVRRGRCCVTSIAEDAAFAFRNRSSAR